MNLVKNATKMHNNSEQSVESVAASELKNIP